MSTFLIVAIGILAWFSVICLVVAFLMGANTAKVMPPYDPIIAWDEDQINKLSPAEIDAMRGGF